jgi:fido (protein-threonine AMPylation protein)
MERRFRPPKDDQELKQSEAAGLWQAQALAKEIGESPEKITLEVILRIHKVFFQHAVPGIAGRFRKPGEDINKLKYILPPPGSAVQARMYNFWREFDTRLSQVPSLPKDGGKKSTRKALERRNDAVIGLATWTQHQIAAIHPFCEGNGRMARLMTNLVLHRHRLQPTDIKYEGENKTAYLDALGAIDLKEDYRPLRQLVIKGTIASFQKLVAAQQKAARKGAK